MLSVPTAHRLLFTDHCSLFTDHWSLHADRDSLPVKTAKHDTLVLKIVIHRLRPVLVTDARRLDAAERQFVVPVVNLVHPRHAGLDLARGAIRPAHVLRPDRRAEAPLAGVGLLDRLVERLDFPHPPR